MTKTDMLRYDDNAAFTWIQVNGKVDIILLDKQEKLGVKLREASGEYRQL